jgi:hypothetical protein
MAKKGRRGGVQWDHVAYVESHSERGKEYEIKRRRQDGHHGCSCKSYQFARGIKGCKHLDAFFAHDSVGKQLAAVYAGRPEAARAMHHPHPVVVQGETFTVRRAISFGAIPVSA